MKYIIIFLLIIGCSKKTATYKDKPISYKEHTFGKQVDLYNGERIIKKFKYIIKEKTSKKEWLRKEITNREYSCTYTGLCRYYDYNKSKYRFGLSSSCDGDRMEKREYSYYKVSPSLTYKNRNGSILLVLSPYKTSKYKTLDIGACK